MTDTMESPMCSARNWLLTAREDDPLSSIVRRLMGEVEHQDVRLRESSDLLIRVDRSADAFATECEALRGRVAELERERAELLSPPNVLREAERLLRERARVYPRRVRVDLWSDGRTTLHVGALDARNLVSGATLGDCYDALTEDA